MKKILRSKAVFVFTIETADNNTLMESGKGFRLLKSGRFGYSREYINNLISKYLGPEFTILMYNYISFIYLYLLYINMLKQQQVSRLFSTIGIRRASSRNTLYNTKRIIVLSL